MKTGVLIAIALVVGCGAASAQTDARGGRYVPDPGGRTGTYYPPRGEWGPPPNTVAPDSSRSTISGTDGSRSTGPSRPNTYGSAK